MLVFEDGEGGGGTGEPGEKHSEQGGNQQQTQPTHGSVFKLFPAFSNSSGLRSIFENLHAFSSGISVDGRPNLRNKAAISNFPGVAKQSLSYQVVRFTSLINGSTMLHILDTSISSPQFLETYSSKS